MSRSTQKPRREKVSLCFITSDPSSNDLKTNNLHIVRSHAGKWRWSEARKKKTTKGQDNVGPRDKTTTGFSYGHSISIAEEQDASDSSSTLKDFSTGSKDSTPGDDLDALFGTLEGDVFGIEYPPFEEKLPTYSVEIPESQTPDYYNARAVNVYGITPNILDPFQQYPHNSPLPLELVSSANKYSLSMLWPGLLPPTFGTSHPGVNAWLASSATHDALHSTLLFGSYSHRRTLWLVKRRGHFNDDDAKRLAICEADAIMKVNRAIQNLSGAATDFIILCVLCMATNKVEGPMWNDSKERVFQAPLTSLQWLDVYGRLSPHPVHQAGLVQLVRFRGGLENIDLPGLSAIISYSSVLGASRSLSRPSFPYISLQTGGYLNLQDIIDTSLDLFESTHIPPEVQTIFQCQQTYVSEIEMYEDGMQVGTDVLCDHRNIIQWHIMSLLPSTQLGSSHAQAYPLYESCRLALIIFGVGVTFPLPPQSAPLVTLSRMLKIELRSYLQDIQDIPPSARSLYLWILTLGAIAATGSSEREWFVDRLQFHTACHGISRLDDFESELKSVLWLHGACFLAGSLLWDEIMS